MIHCICNCGLTCNSGGDTVSKIGVEKRNEVLWKQKGNLSFDLTSELTEVIPVNSKTEIVVALYNPVKILGSLGVSYNENEWNNHVIIRIHPEECGNVKADPVIEP